MRTIILLFFLQLFIFAQSGQPENITRFTPNKRNDSSTEIKKNKSSEKEAAVENLFAALADSATKANRPLQSQLQTAGERAEARKWALWDKNKEAFYRRVQQMYWLMFFWFLLFFGIIFYALYRYNFNAGLNRKKYRELVRKIDRDNQIPVDQKAAHYPQNPYKTETFGVPRGTVRGFLTFTLLIVNCLILYILIYAPPESLLEGRLEYVKTAFLMMIAFYFGTRAVEVLRTREETRRGLTGLPGPAPLSPENNMVLMSEQPEIPLNLRPASSPMSDFELPDSKLLRIAAQFPGAKPAAHNKCLALTTYFETGKTLEEAFATVTGNFDGQGISFGCLQWNLGQGTLQPILQSYFGSGDQGWKKNTQLRELHQILEQPVSVQLEWANSIQEKQDEKFVFFDEWQKAFRILGKKTRDFQLQACEERFGIAEGWCFDWGLTSERALALMFDINVQNGILYKRVPSRDIDVRESIQQRIVNAGYAGEAEKLVIVAEERSKAALPRWQRVVLQRKMAIARGKGKVYGAMVDLADFNISIERSFDETSQNT